jgi:hypothetical protein
VKIVAQGDHARLHPGRPAIDLGVQLAGRLGGDRAPAPDK